jgi:hypothetical protein
MEKLRTDRLGLLLDQLDRARELAQARLEGLASPASLPMGTPLDPRQHGGGRLSDEEYLWEPTPGAWSIRRRDQTATPRAFGPGEWVLERFWTLMDRWRDSVAAMPPEQLEVPGFGQYPNGSDPEEPFITVVWWTNLEFIHHMAEIALLRDLWRARSTSLR